MPKSMLKPFASLCVSAALVFSLSTASHAVEIDKIAPGDVFFISGFGANTQVMVKEIDYNRKIAKVTRQDGTTDWVRVDSLLTSNQNTGTEIGEAVGWTAVTIGVFCLLVDSCRESMQQSAK